MSCCSTGGRPGGTASCQGPRTASRIASCASPAHALLPAHIHSPSTHVTITHTTAGRFSVWCAMVAAHTSMGKPDLGVGRGRGELPVLLEAPVIISQSSTPHAYTSHAIDSSPSLIVSGACTCTQQQTQRARALAQVSAVSKRKRSTRRNVKLCTHTQECWQRRTSAAAKEVHQQGQSGTGAGAKQALTMWVIVP